MPDVEKTIRGLSFVVGVMYAIADKEKWQDAGIKEAEKTCNDAIKLLKEQDRIIKQYQKADGFLFAHGWKWE